MVTPDLNDPRTLTGLRFQNRQTGAYYCVIEEHGCFYLQYENGHRQRWAQPQSTAQIPRTYHTQPGNPSGFDPDATPRPQHAFPRSFGGSSNQQNLSPDGRYLNESQYSDRHGIAAHTADGPQHLITDSQLYTAYKKLFATPGNSERLDPAYRKRDDPRHFFRIGKVFLLLWPEPAGIVDNGNQSEVTRGLFAELVHHKIRRFVVVREGINSCAAIPILTYGLRGVSKHDTIKSEHAIIYTAMRGDPTPQPLPIEIPQRDEPGMLRPIRVDPFTQGETLHSQSRVNFGKVYTIEHYVKVKGFGVCTAPELLEAQFDAVWSSRRLPRAQPAQARPARPASSTVQPAPSRQPLAASPPPQTATYTRPIPTTRPIPIPGASNNRTPSVNMPATGPTPLSGTPYRIVSSSAGAAHSTSLPYRSMSQGQYTASPPSGALRQALRQPPAQLRRGSRAQDDDTSSEDEAVH